MPNIELIAITDDNEPRPRAADELREIVRAERAERARLNAIVEFWASQKRQPSEAA